LRALTKPPDAITASAVPPFGGDRQANNHDDLRRSGRTFVSSRRQSWCSAC